LNKKLGWLKDNLPDGWLLNYREGTYWLIPKNEANAMYYCKVIPSHGDIGLAPLTALLKQELNKGGNSVMTVIWSPTRTDCRRGVDDPIGGATEFEAVFNAYKEMRETNLG
jgi:hypothetical protein